MFTEETFKSMPKYESFEYWFMYDGKGCGLFCGDKYNVISAVDGSNVTDIYYSSDSNLLHDCSGVPEDLSEEIREDFERFKNRPEFLVGKFVDTMHSNMETLVTDYETLIAGIYLLAEYVPGVTNPDGAHDKIFSCLNWLRNTDMYTAPASTKYHEAYPGGLLVHSLNVYNYSIELLRLPPFNKVSCRSAALVSLVHDWCKIGLYEQYMRNVKNDETGKWEQKPDYRYNQTGVTLGHGVSSMFLASRCFKLSVEEALSIRWHMGFCRVADSDISELQASNEKYPLVHLLQFADQLSITNYVKVAPDPANA